jgi:hypothetical protein
MYEKKPKKGAEWVEKIKFQPRYQRVLSMAAGYLSDRSEISEKAKTGLQAFLMIFFQSRVILRLAMNLDYLPGALRNAKNLRSFHSMQTLSIKFSNI